MKDDGKNRVSERKKDHVYSFAPLAHLRILSSEILYISSRGIHALRCTALSPKNFLSVAFLNGDARSPFTRKAEPRKRAFIFL